MSSSVSTLWCSLFQLTNTSLKSFILICTYFFVGLGKFILLFTYCLVWPNIKNVVKSAGRSVYSNTLPLKYCGKLHFKNNQLLTVDNDNK